MFGKRTCAGQFHWKGQRLEIVQSYSYLGICLSSSGKYSEARKHVAKQARKATFPLLNLFARLNHPPMSVMLKLYEAYLIPIMCYGCEIWGFQEDESIERVELWILKHNYAAYPYINPYNGSPRRIRATPTPTSPVVERKNTKILE